MGWFAFSFTMVIAVGLAVASYPQVRDRLRLRHRFKSQPLLDTGEPDIKAAERAVYDARSEEEYRRALKDLFEVSSRSLDGRVSSHYTRREATKRATG